MGEQPDGERFKLTTIGSRDVVEVDAVPAAPQEAAGGITLWSRSQPGTPLEDATACTFTASETHELVRLIQRRAGSQGPRLRRAVLPL